LVSALSDHLMGPEVPRYSVCAPYVSVSALSDHLMGQPLMAQVGRFHARFSIRSFGSFDGTLEAVRRIFTRKVGFSIRSFGSFDGTAAEGLGIEFGREFQYPLFRII